MNNISVGICNGIVMLQFKDRNDKEVSRKVGQVVVYKGIYMIKLFACSPELQYIGLSVALIQYLAGRNISAITWQDVVTKEWKYIRVNDILEKCQIVDGRETQDYYVDVTMFKTLRDQAQSWMKDLKARKKCDRKAKVVDVRSRACKED